MQKKLIALALAALASGTAFAQSNVTIYGIADVGYSYKGDNITPNVGSRSAFESGQQSGSRLGFRGTEDLGNGLSALFVLETGIAMDNGGYTDNLAYGRQAYAGLSSKSAGTVAIGRQYTPQYNLISKTDPFAFGTVGRINNTYAVTSRLNNLAAYVSPSFNGLTVTAGYTFNGTGNENVDNKTGATSNETRVWALSPVYANGPLFVGLNYHNVKVEGASYSTKVWDLAGTYDFGVAKLAAAYGQDNDINPAKDDRRKYMLGVTVPVSKTGSLLASYVYAKTDTAGADPKSRQFAIGYEHNLSKRTNLYFAYADISNKNGAQAQVGDNTNGGFGYQNGASIGLRHKF